MKQKIKTGIIMTTIAIGLLHIINRCISAAAIVKNLLTKERGHYYEWRFGKVYYTKTGNGSPLLLIHDLSPYASSYEWNSLVKTLSKTHTVYCIDLLGCGRSERPNLTYTSYFYVQLVNDFIDQVICEKTDIAATGFSSSFVVMACYNNPELFNKIVLINPQNIQNLQNTPSRRSKIIKFIMDFPIIGTAVYNIYMRRENLEYFFTENYFYNPFLVTKKMLDVYYESAHLNESGGKYLLSSLHGFYVNANISKALKEINNSIFIIEGAQNPGAKETVDSYLKLNPSIESEYIADTKLYPQLETPEMVLEHLNIFLQ